MNSSGSPMRVGVVDPSFFTLAYDQHLCAGLHGAGVDVSLCGRVLRADERAQPHGYRLEARCYPLTERGGQPGNGRTRAWLKAFEHVMDSARFAKWLRSRFDVLHFQWSPMPAVDGRLWQRLARDRTVLFTVHDTTPFLGQPTSRLQALGWRGLLDAAHGLIVHTESSRRALIGLGVEGERIDVVPHGPLSATPLVEGARVASQDGRRVLLVFGEIKPYKGIDVLLRAAARLPHEVAAGWKIVIAGRPRCDLTELQALALEARLPVEWRLGFVRDADIAPLFSEADVVVFPYRHIDASGALMLALPFGIPVVASRVGVFAELLEDGVTGLLARPGDEVDLARALERVMTDAALREHLRTQVLDRVKRIWSWASIAQAHVDIYRKRAGLTRTERRAASPADAGHAANRGPALVTDRHADRGATVL